MKLALATFLLVLTTLAARADTTEGYLCRSDTVFEPVTCSLTVSDGLNGATVIDWRGEGLEVRWVGQTGFGITFGTLNGQDAACYAHNRSHYECTTKDRQSGFEYWWPGANADER